MNGKNEAANSENPTKSSAQQPSKRPWLAALLSLIPGFGHIYNGERGVGFIFFCFFIQVGLFSAPYAPREAQLVFIATFLAIVFDAFWTARSRLTPRWQSVRAVIMTSVILGSCGTEMRFVLPEGDRGTVHSIRVVRSAINRYKSEKGASPSTLESLVPDYLESMPLLRLRDHEGPQKIVNSRTMDLSDEGGWQYVIPIGEVYINCTHPHTARFNDW